jgi:hypothetical protein
MFETSDSQIYLSVSNWIVRRDAVDTISTRPFLYPLIILFFNKIGGASDIFLFQFLCWLLMVNLTFLSLQKLTEKYFYSYVGSLILITNFSLIAMTLHALTEVIIALLLSLLIFLMIKHRKRLNTLILTYSTLLILSLLTVIKTVLYINLLLSIVILIVFYSKEYIYKSP